MTTEQVQAVFGTLRKSREVKNQTEFGAKLGFGHSFASQLLSGKQDPPDNLEEKIKNAFPDLDIDEVYAEVLVTNIPVSVTNGTADKRKPYTNQYGVRFEPLRNGKWRMTNKQVPFAAHAAYKAGWGDPEWMGSLPDHTMIVDAPHDDNVITFPVIGDCQDDGTRQALYDGEAITGRSISRSMWQYKLPFRSPEESALKVNRGSEPINVPEKSERHMYWIFLDFKEGLQIGMITKHDTEKGIIHCTCRNPKKGDHPDFKIHIDDCAQIFFGIAVERKL